MPENLVDVDTSYPATVTVPTDTDPRNALSVRTPFKTVADRTAYLRSIVAPSPMPVKKIVIAAAAMTQPKGGWTIDGFGDSSRLVASAFNARLILDLGALLPSGAIVSTVRALVTPASAHAGGFEMYLDLLKITPDFGTPATGTAASVGTLDGDDGTATLQVLSVTATHTIVTGELLVAQITSGNDGTITDNVHAIEINFQDPGPRSF